MSGDDQTRRIVETIREHFSWYGRVFNEGDFVAVLDGQIVAVDSNVDNAIAALRAVAPDPMRGMVVEVAHPVVDVIR